jgi:hypothetical protein
MKTSIRRGVLLALALALAAGPLLATAADARNDRYRERPRTGAPDRPNYSRGPAREQPGYITPERPGNRWGSGRERPRNIGPERPGNRWGPGYRERPVYREYRNDRRYHRGSGVVPFLGGLAIGAIIGGHSYNYCPPPPPPVVQRVYVYDCPWCPFQVGDYDAWVAHLMEVHRVPGYQINDYYPPFSRGHWEVY